MAIALWGKRNAAGDERQLERATMQENCGWWLMFRRILNGDQGARLYAASFCRQSTCPFCAVGRAARAMAAYLPKIITTRFDTPGRRLMFVTLTIPAGADLRHQLDFLDASLAGLTSRFWNRSRCVNEMRAFDGGLGQVEIKRGRKPGTWHVHYHGLWEANRRVDFDGFQRMWSDAVGIDQAWCNVKHLQTEQRLRQGEQFTADELRQALAGDVAEVIKYPMKFGELTPADVWACSRVIFRRRLLRSFGCLKGVKVPSLLVDPPIDWDQVPWVELLFRYSSRGFQQATRVQNSAQPADGQSHWERHGLNTRSIPAGATHDE